MKQYKYFIDGQEVSKSTIANYLLTAGYSRQFGIANLHKGKVIFSRTGKILKAYEILKIRFKIDYQIGNVNIKEGEVHEVKICHINNIDIPNTKGFQGCGWIIPVCYPGIEIIEGEL